MSSSEPPTIRLDQFLKAQGLVDTGGQAKRVIQEGLVQVNGEQETRRRRQLRAGDIVQWGNSRILVEFESDSP